jgi:protein-S-isoprenylcysteine O-methyltransferase Ste14
MPMEALTRTVVIRLAFWYAIMAALLFGSAGTLNWGEAWLYLLVQGSLSTMAAIWMQKHNPDLLRERMTFLKRSAKDWDKSIIVLGTVMSIPLYGLPGLDAVRYRWSHIPSWLECVGFVGILIANAVIYRTMKANPYLTRLVEVQKDRGHQVVTTGPYQYVRHPMYAGVLLWLLCFPLALGSWTTIIPSLYLIGLMVVRTGLEDKTLHEELDGYAQYAEKVRCRLVPRIW